MRAGSWSPQEERPDGLERDGVGILLFPGRRNSGCPLLCAPAPPPASPRSPSLWKFWRRGKEAKGSHQFFFSPILALPLVFAKRALTGSDVPSTPILDVPEPKRGMHKKCSGNCPTRPY